MDYDNSKIFFLNNHINIMREDMENYINITIPQRQK